jgi:hypothetical protein
MNVNNNIKLKWMSKYKTYAVLYASKLSTICDMNKYESREDLIKEFKSALSKEQFVSVDEKAIEKISIMDQSEKELVQEIIKDKDELNTTVEIIKTKLEKIKTNKNIDKDVCDYVQKQLYTSFGNKEEDVVRETYCKSRKVNYTKNNAFLISNKPAIVINGYKVYLGGKHDGENENGDFIEIKNRMNRFMDEIPLYEIVQVHAYMFIHDKKKCSLIENFKGKTKVHIIEFDDVLWEKIIQNIKTFMDIIDI